MGKDKAKLEVRAVGVQTEKDFNSISNGMVGLLKAFGGKNLKVKVTRTIFCNDCKRQFKSFIELRKHLKKTGHKDVTES